MAGVKVGKVDQIKFFETGHKFKEEPVILSLRMVIDQRAKHLIRDDSKFYITNAGIIGEKYIEITAGSPSAKVLENGASIRGIDPPRLDELVAQAYSIFEKLNKSMEAMKPEDKEKLSSLFDNLVKLSSSLSDFGAHAEQLTGLAEDAHKLVKDLDSLASPLAPKTAADRVAYDRKIKELSQLVDRLNSMSVHLNRLSAKADTELQDVTKSSLERTIRQILQQEGVTINLGQKFGKLSYPPLPEPGYSSTAGK